MMVSPFIGVIDAQQFGLPRTGAVYLIQGSSPSLIESGTALSVATIYDSLGNLSPKYIFLTHIHLDHAGGAGHLAQAYPQTKIVVHERGCRHLVNPSRLIEGVRNASPDLFQEYGEPIAVPEHQLLPVAGGEVFDLGKNVQLEVIAAPGHAPHHVCLFERISHTLFTGDAVGNWNNPVNIPLTVPPRFNLIQGLETLQVLKRLRPDRLAFTHFGIADEARTQLDRYEGELIDWFEDLRRLSRELPSTEIVDQILRQPKFASLSEIQRSMVTMCIRGGLLSLEADPA